MSKPDARGEKVLVRVLAAVEDGLDTSAAVADALDLPLVAASARLRDLYCCGALTREKLPVYGPGRPGYRYRILTR